MSTLETQLAALFPQGAVVRIAAPRDWDARLPDEEAAFVARAVLKRRREFAAGRQCARAALVELGSPTPTLLRDRDRVPAWPAGVVGSISHCDDLCAVVVAAESTTAAVGLDVERDGPLPEEVANTVLSETERSRAEVETHALGGLAWSKLVWSAKEAFYKSYFPAVRRSLEFGDAEVELVNAGRFRVSLTNADAPALFGRRQVDGRFLHSGQHVFTALAVEAAEDRWAVGGPGPGF